MRLAWLTDIHLNFIDEVTRQKFYKKIVDTKCGGVLISGDIAEAPCLIDILNEMAGYINKPIYFVLGNHDYYRGLVKEVHDAMTVLTKKHDTLFWLPASGMQALDNNTFLIGQDGWADGRFGDYQNSRVSINDSRMIGDLFQAKILGKFQLLEKMQELADADALLLQRDLNLAASKDPGKIIVLTHVPPFKESCMHMGKVSDDNWLPYFSSKVIGDVLTAVALKHPEIEFLVLCGHTHSESNYKPLPNLIVKAGKTEYRYPEVQEIIVL
jgi:predicted MPP superfamily phosphohydrolase